MSLVSDMFMVDPFSPPKDTDTVTCAKVSLIPQTQAYTHNIRIAQSNLSKRTFTADRQIVCKFICHKIHTCAFCVPFIALLSLCSCVFIPLEYK